MTSGMLHVFARRYTCVVCSQLISPESEFYELDDAAEGRSSSRKMHAGCWGDCHSCLQCGVGIAEAAEYYEVDDGKMVHGAPGEMQPPRYTTGPSLVPPLQMRPSMLLSVSQ
jgi:hypothetical protein